MLLLTSFALATTVDFAGLTWNVRSGAGGPGPNQWSDAPDAVWVDEDGALHLTIRQDTSGAWQCTEVWTDEPTTYGPHTFYVDTRFDLFDPNVVLGLFTYQDDTHEIDVELAKWGDPTGDSLWYTIQPPDNASQWSAAPTLEGSFTTHQFDWQPGSVHFRSWHGHYAEPPDSSWVFGDYTSTAAHIPDDTAAMPVHINLWLMSGLAPTDGQEVEVVIRGIALPGASSGDTGDTGDTGNETGDTGDDTAAPDTAADTGDPADTHTPTDTAGSDDTGTPKDGGGCGCTTGSRGMAGAAWVGSIAVALRRRRAGVGQRWGRGPPGGEGAGGEPRQRRREPSPTRAV
jgi:hypothetical protein